MKLLAFFIIILGLVGAAGLYFVSQTHGDPTGRQIKVTIEQGATATSIADALAKAGVIRSPWLFRILARTRGTASALSVHVKLHWICGVGLLIGLCLPTSITHADIFVPADYPTIQAAIKS